MPPRFPPPSPTMHGASIPADDKSIATRPTALIEIKPAHRDYSSLARARQTLVARSRSASSCDRAGAVHGDGRKSGGGNMMRRIGAALLVASAIGLGAGAARADDKVVICTDWRAEPEHGGLYQALATGIYAAK